MNATQAATPIQYLTRTYGDIQVSYLPHLDGGGLGFGQDYMPVIENLYGQVERAYEFCAGPGFIGFAMLAAGLCRTLCLSDINPEAVEAARDTVRRNGLEDRVSVYLSDSLNDIPAEEQWDLVVSNPPHFKDDYVGSLRHYDEDWNIHKNFYAAVGKHLKPGGIVLFQENYEGSTEADFEQMIHDNGLVLDDVFMYRDADRRNYLDTYYFLAVRAATDARKPLPASGLFDTQESMLTIAEPSDNNVFRLQASKGYRFRFRDDRPTPRTLLVFALRFGIVPRFCRTFSTLPTGEWTSFPFHFYPGTYVLKDEDTRQTYARVIVE